MGCGIGHRSREAAKEILFGHYSVAPDGAFGDGAFFPTADAVGHPLVAAPQLFAVGVKIGFAHRRHLSDSGFGFRAAESELPPKMGLEKRSPSPRPSPPGEGEARTVLGIYTPFGVELLHGDLRLAMMATTTRSSISVKAGNSLRTCLLFIESMSSWIEFKQHETFSVPAPIAKQ